MKRWPLVAFASLSALGWWTSAHAQISPCLDDAQLAQLRNALVYVWSPRMVLSAQHAATARDQAQRSGLQFVPVHDGKLTHAEVRDALQTLAASSQAPLPRSATALTPSRPLCATRLNALEATRHFPTAFVMGEAGQPHPNAIVGAMPPAAWAAAIQQRRSTANSPASPQTCIARNVFHPLPDELVGSQKDGYGQTRVILGSYERVSPDGRFILRSFSGGKLGEVSLIELDETGRPIQAHDTPLSNEAFPVQGSWRYLVNVNGDHFRFKDILLHQTGQPARPRFNGGMTGFYAAAAELPGPTDTQVRIRSMSWPNATGDSDTQGEGALQVRTLTVDIRNHRIVHDTGGRFLCQHRTGVDGTQYALPMIGVDGEEFAALPQLPVQGQATMRIYAFGSTGAGCEPQTRFDFSSGKTIFGFSGPERKADVAYEYRGQVWWFHRGPGMGQGHRFNIAPDEPDPRIQWMANAFPGITRDGRIIYAATRRDCPQPGQPCTETVGYVTADPYQSHDYRNHLQAHPHIQGRNCITQADVRREREAFARQHELNSQPRP